MKPTADTPYAEIFADLLQSVMRAQGAVAKMIGGTTLADIPDGLINRHFSWLALAYDEGENRHLFDGSSNTRPLRVKGLRFRANMSSHVRELLEKRMPPPLEGNESAFSQELPTRISRLVKASFVTSDLAESEPRDVAELSGLVIKSPLSVVYDFLTVPDMPGTRGYALLPLRNFIFETFGVFPGDVGLVEPSATFSVADVEEALSFIWTSLRPRFFSKGRAPFPAEGKTATGGMLRHFLAARGILWMRFAGITEAIEFLEEATLRPEEAPYDFVRSSHLERLPELGEMANELWGLPIPIRGADTILKGGLKFSSRRGLVIGLHGGPGTGKTSIALALGAVLAPFGIDTLFVTAEENPSDLEAKAESLISDTLRRLSFFPERGEAWLAIQHLLMDEHANDSGKMLEVLESALAELSEQLSVTPTTVDLSAAPRPCRAVVVLDGVHDLLMAASDYSTNTPLVQRLRQFIVACRNLHALVILTAGEDWEGERALDYLVDVAIRLGHDSVDDAARKPDRQITVSKARHQLCAIGTHGLQISGAKGVRFSPQINYQLDRKALWRTRLPEMHAAKKVMRLGLSQTEFDRFSITPASRRSRLDLSFRELPQGLSLFRGSNVFLNGEGSGGKAALALKMAISPTWEGAARVARAEKVLIVSFLYPREYYDNILRTLLTLRRLEYGMAPGEERPSIEVIHLYPGNYRADQLFNRVEWELDAAELQGDPYTSVLIDGLHNVFLQFPEIEEYTLFWPQLYAALRSRPITIISTHTTFVLQGAAEGSNYRLDDQRSEPLRHALVQKTDFRFEIDPYLLNEDGIYERAMSASTSNVFCIRAVSAINQPIPDVELMWSREHLLLFEPRARTPARPPQGELDFGEEVDNVPVTFNRLARGPRSR